jgi:hypothetical protein
MVVHLMDKKVKLLSHLKFWMHKTSNKGFSIYALFF